MEAKNFRIGNWVRVPTKDSEIIIPSFDAQIQSIGLFGMLGFLNTPKIKGVKWSVKAIKPIPLTEEWLTKFGFKKDDGFFNKDGVWLTPDFGLDGINPFKPIKYVHQLQNLFFAITGEELTLENEN